MDQLVDAQTEEITDLQQQIEALNAEIKQRDELLEEMERELEEVKANEQ